jgi:hypothetical protein
MCSKRIFKSARPLILIMGAHEALTLLEALRRHGALTPGNARRYVLEALYGGAEVKEGTPAYEALENRVYRSLTRTEHRPAAETAEGNGDQLRPEAADYLGRILGEVAGSRRRCLSRFSTLFDGFSEEAHAEVAKLLGTYGRRYLGIGRRDSLMPSATKVRAIRYDYDEAPDAPDATASVDPWGQGLEPSGLEPLQPIRIDKEYLAPPCSDPPLAGPPEPDWTKWEPAGLPPTATPANTLAGKTRASART